jgi:hypothetical protein
MIVCEAKQNIEMKQYNISGGSIYLSHYGYVTPCCWQGTLVSLKTIWKESGLDPKLHNINHYSIQEILDGPVFKWIEDQWTATNSTETKKVCQKKCERGQYDKPKSQHKLRLHKTTDA